MHEPLPYTTALPLALRFFQRRAKGFGLAGFWLAVAGCVAPVVCVEAAEPTVTAPKALPFIHWPFLMQDRQVWEQEDDEVASEDPIKPDANRSDADTAHTAEKPLWDYALGGTFKSSDLAQFTRTAGLEPVVGLRYGRWKLGIGDGTEWLRFNSFRKDSSLDYKWLDTHRYSLSLSLQLHTLTGGEGSDAPESGPRTVRGRAVANMAITRRWQAGLAFTQDLLGKGDGSTLGFGVSYAWPLDPRSELVLNAGLTWGTAGHWRNAYGPLRLGADTLRTGIDSWGLGLGYKHRLARHWAWFGSLSFSGDRGPMAELPGNHKGRSGQIGLLYFHR